jgi:hypothetical protein
MRAARQRRDREFVLLALWSLVGFGERILRPLVLWLGVAIGLAAWGHFTLANQAGWWSDWEAFLRLAASPLGFLRLDLHGDGVAASSWDEFFFATAQVLGTLTLGSAIYACARIARSGRT